MPTIVTTTIGSGGDHATAVLWEGATDNDLVAADEIQRGALLERHSSAKLTIAGATTSPTQHRDLTPDSSIGRYDPVGDTGAGITGAVQFTQIQVDESNMHFTSILLENTHDATSSGTNTLQTNPGAGMIVDECTIKRNLAGGSTGTGVCVELDDSGTATPGYVLRNCAIFGDPNSSNITGIQAEGDDTIIQNVSIYNCPARGYRIGFATVPAAPFEVTNLIIMGSGITDFDLRSASDTLFTFCLSEDASAAGFADSFGNQTIADIFNDADADDLTLVRSGNAADNGLDLSSDFTTDLNGTTRTVPWDMGCYDSVGGAALVQIIDETVQIPETIVRAMAMSRVVDEVVQLVEGVEQHRAISQVIDEVVQLLETTVRPRVMVRLVNEVEQVEETTLRPRVMVRMVNEEEQVVEAVEQHRAITQLVNEVVEIPETVARVLGIIQVVNEIVQIVEAAEQHRAITQLVNEVVQVPETVFRPRVMVRLVDEIVQLLETTTRPRAMIRVVDETLQVVEIVAFDLSVAGAAGPTVIIDVVLGAVSIDVPLVSLIADVPLVSLIADVNLPALSADIS